MKNLKFKKLMAIALAFALIFTCAAPVFANELSTVNGIENMHENKTLDFSFLLDENFISEERRREAQLELESLDMESRLQALRENRDGKYTVISEFEVYRELRALEEDSLYRADLSENQLYFVQNFTQQFVEQVELFQTLEDETLKCLGYTEEQIYIIRNFQGTYEQIEALSARATVNLSADFARYSRSAGRTSSRLSFTFVWSGVPVFGMTDLMAVGWDGWVLASSHGNLMYRNINVRDRIIWRAPTFVASDQGSGFGAGFRYPAKINDNAYFAAEGWATFVVDSAGRRDMHATGTLSHSRITFSLNPTFSVGVTGVSPSITVSAGVNPLRFNDSASARVTDHP